MRLLIFVAAAVLVYGFLKWLSRQPTGIKWQYGSIAVGLLLLGLAATGRLSWVAALIGATLPFARRFWGLLAYLPTLQRILGHLSGAQAAGSASSSDQTSSVETEYLRMTLHHASGEMNGEIRKGAHQGSRLADLRLEQLSDLLGAYAQRDPESATLLRTYLERRFGEQWEEDLARSRQGHPGNADTTGGDEMSVAEALAILGLEAGATGEEIIESHRRLMQKLHPDRGGSTYLATKLNAAKKVLLKN